MGDYVYRVSISLLTYLKALLRTTGHRVFQVMNVLEENQTSMKSTISNYKRFLLYKQDDVKWNTNHLLCIIIRVRYIGRSKRWETFERRNIQYSATFTLKTEKAKSQLSILILSYTACKYENRSECSLLMVELHLLHDMDLVDAASKDLRTKTALLRLMRSKQ